MKPLEYKYYLCYNEEYTPVLAVLFALFHFYMRKSDNKGFMMETQRSFAAAGRRQCPLKSNGTLILWKDIIRKSILSPESRCKNMQ